MKLSDRRFQLADLLSDRTETPRRAPWVNGKPKPGTRAAELWAMVRRGDSKVAPGKHERLEVLAENLEPVEQAVFLLWKPDIPWRVIADKLEIPIGSVHGAVDRLRRYGMIPMARSKGNAGRPAKESRLPVGSARYKGSREARPPADH